jgi:hypothetical protein
MTATTETTDITIVSGPTSSGTASDWELFFARRALATLKARLGRQGLLDLLQPDLAASAKTLTACAASSDGQWRPAVTQLHAEVLAYFHSIFDDSPQLVAAHPEHFVLASTDGGHQVVENLGPYITDFRIAYISEDQTIGELVPDYPIRLAGTVALPDGTLIGHALHQFRDTGTGFDALLVIYFPAAAPDDLIEGHRQHLAVEFTNWITAAGLSLGRTSHSPVPPVVT